MVNHSCLAVYNLGKFLSEPNNSRILYYSVLTPTPLLLRVESQADFMALKEQQLLDMLIGFVEVE